MTSVAKENSTYLFVKPEVDMELQSTSWSRRETEKDNLPYGERSFLPSDQLRDLKDENEEDGARSVREKI